MKIKYKNQTAFKALTITGGVGAVTDSAEVTDFPTLDAGDAILLNYVAVGGDSFVQAKAALTEFSVVWGVSGVEFGAADSIFGNELAMVVSSKAGGLAAESLFRMGGLDDFFNLRGLEEHGVFSRYPAKHIYAGVACSNMEAGALIFRLGYDIATLSQGEMADLFSRDIC